MTTHPHARVRNVGVDEEEVLVLYSNCAALTVALDLADAHLHRLGLHLREHTSVRVNNNIST